MRAQMAWILVLVASMAVGADEKQAMKELVPCLAQADRTRVAAFLVKSGQSKEAMEAQLSSSFAGLPPAELEAYKAALREAVADNPADPDAYIAQKLNQCVAKTSSASKQHVARPCYQTTLYAHEIYAAKEQKLPLEQVKKTSAENLTKAGLSADYVKAVQALATGIYGADQPEAVFRPRWFASCVIQSK
ncbi:MAG: hypothetical protein K0Q76_3837 [Panacagrimonas sp.]|nr:hypothetical protein [Panacagrimonas sp.]MCC2658729.1 hypothetical protein [Panacagrimonas sp.]